MHFYFFRGCLWLYPPCPPEPELRPPCCLLVNPVPEIVEDLPPPRNVPNRQCQRKTDVQVERERSVFWQEDLQEKNRAGREEGHQNYKH